MVCIPCFRFHFQPSYFVPSLSEKKSSVSRLILKGPLDRVIGKNNNHGLNSLLLFSFSVAGTSTQYNDVIWWYRTNTDLKFVESWCHLQHSGAVARIVEVAAAGGVRQSSGITAHNIVVCARVHAALRVPLHLHRSTKDWTYILDPCRCNTRTIFQYKSSPSEPLALKLLMLII